MRISEKCRQISSLLALITTMSSPVVFAQFPDTECDPSGAPANATIPADLLNYCTTHSGADCDLVISNWDLTTHRSPDIRMGDAFNPSGPSSPEVPRFFLDKGVATDPTDDRFYTKLYVKFRNAGGGIGGGGPAPATEVTVDFYYKEANSAADVDGPAPWTAAGTMVATVMENTYPMNIPAPAAVGALFPSIWHLQQRGVCWSLPAGTNKLPEKFILKAELNWGQDNDTDSNTAYSFYDLSSMARKAQIGFAIDLSGSMNAPFESSTRLTVAKQKAALFATLVEDDNQLGVFSFSTGNSANTAFTTTYNSPATLPQSYSDTSQISSMQTISGDLQRGFIAGQIDNPAVTASGCTPMGQGLLRARHAINNTTPPAGPPTPGKAIVLFSDGMQNIAPYVDAAPPWHCAGVSTLADINTLQTFSDENINIYSIFFGPEMGWGFNLMNKLKTDTNGDYVYGASSEVELASAYYSIRALVDDMIYLDENGSVGTSAPWPVFEVEFDAASTLATAAVAWPYGNGETRLALYRRLKGTNKWQACTQQQHSANTYQAASYLVCRFTPGANSSWQFRVRQTQSDNQASVTYTAAVFSEVQQVQITPSLDDTHFTVGDALPIQAELRSAGLPVFGATVTAQIKVPSRSFSTTLQNYAGSFTKTSTNADANKVTSMASQLGQFLAKDTGSNAIYVYNTIQLSLRDDGKGADKFADDGIYSGLLPGDETRIAGDYEVTIKAQATLAGNKTVERIAKLSTIANVGSADAGKSIVTINIPADPVGDVKVATVTVVPYDKFGNAAFPGSGNTIQIAASGASARSDLVDNLDASYSQRFNLDRDDARFTVTVGNVQLPAKSAAEQLAGGTEISLHAGVAVPRGNFANEFNSGPSLALDYAYRLRPELWAKAEAALDIFEGKSGFKDANMMNISAYMQYRVPIRSAELYFEAGVGVYDLENASSAFGYAAGAGVRTSITSGWILDVNLQAHSVAGSLDIAYTRLRAGGIYQIQP